MFKHFLTSANESNAFILACDETREAILVDAGEFEPAIAAYIQGNRTKSHSARRISSMKRSSHPA